MNTYLIVKTLHIISATVLFGTGIGIAFFKWRADASGDVPAICVTNRLTVLADMLFTAPSGVVQLATGLYLAHAAGFALHEGWLLAALGLFALAAACWLPVLWLQLRMRDLSRASAAAGSELPALYWRYARAWFALGWPAFIALTIVFWLMVAKPTL
jgi:uncharacterized membrane protein